jgi:hypothetical protein
MRRSSVTPRGFCRRGTGIQVCLLAAFAISVWGRPVGGADGEEGVLSAVHVSWLPENPKQGEVVQLRVIVPPGVHVDRGEMLSRPLRFYSPREGAGRWEALFGIDLDQDPGEYPVRVWLASAKGSAGSEVKASLRILPQAFGEERLTLPESKVHLSRKDLARVKKENARIASVWSAETPERLWDGPFLVPVEGRPGSPFGLRRWINGEPRSAHTGMDIKASEGQPVRAANSGRVVLVGDFFFGGNSVFVDHGQGVYTMYMHLSRVRVTEGQEVAKGEVLGLVGMTGRATGPHLHWGVRLGGARVDPESLVDRTGGDL